VSIPDRLKSIPLWKEMWPREALLKKEREEPRTFQRGWRLIALSDEERTFPGWEGCRCHGVSLGEVQRSGWMKFTGVDLASKGRPGTSIVTIAVEPISGRRYPVDLRYGAWRSNETAAEIAAVNRAYRPNVIVIENNAYQDSLIDWCTSNKSEQNDFWMKLEPFTTGKNKVDPLIGLPGLQVEFHHKAWVVPFDEYETHEPSCPCAWCLWDREFRNHPLGATSDMVMATWFARWGAETFGTPIVTGDLGRLNAR